MTLAAGVFKATKGAEVADDAPHLVEFVEKPLVLFGNYKLDGLSDTWGSFPPFLPLVFGVLVKPWMFIASDFWAIRLGVLSWTLLCLITLAWIGRQSTNDDTKLRHLLYGFVLLPTVFGAIAMIPQEEIYVSLFVLAIYWAARRNKLPWLLPLFVATAFAGKYFLLILTLPVAFYVGNPLKRLMFWLPVVIGLLSGYIAFHYIVHGLTPILSHTISPSASISIWALIWNLGWQLPADLVKPLSVLMSGSLVFGFCLVARRRQPKLENMLGISLVITLLCLSITFPAYVLWAIPISLLAGLKMPAADQRAQTILFIIWGGCEWLANFSRGVALALSTTRSSGKTAIAELATKVFGADFPFAAMQSVFIALVILSGVLIIWLQYKNLSQEA
jgi:hypothetical protein